MVTCQVCQQVLPPGRADQRFCSGRCRTRHYRAQKHPQQADQQWRRRLNLDFPIWFRRSDTKQAFLVDREHCWIPTSHWTNQLQILNWLHSLADALTYFADAQGEPGQTDHSEKGNRFPLNDWVSILLTKLDEMQTLLGHLSRSEGQLGLLLRAHWLKLEAGQQTLRVHTQRFALTHQSEEPYVIDLPTAFQEHIHEWGLELSLLWLDLERQTR